MQKILLIDSNNLLHRVFWVHDTYAKTASVPHLFLNSIKKYYNMFSPDVTYLAWDYKLKYGESNFRKTGHVEYKATRDKERNEKIYQYENTIRDLCESLGLRNIFPGVLEADDVIYWLSNRFSNCKKTVVSVDQDLLQLINHNTKVYSPIKDILIDTINFEEVTKVPLPYFTESKALMGDKSDNIPGIPRVGLKRALKLLSEGNLQDNLSTDDYKMFMSNLDLVDLSKAQSFHPEEESLYIEQIEKLKDHVGNIDDFKSQCKELNLKSISESIGEWKNIFFKNAFANELQAFLDKIDK